MPGNTGSHSPRPRATYRFQFNERFRLRDALALVPYLRELGISHIYASPLFKAMPHSTHGYDVCDYSRLNPELGTEADLEELVTALHNCGMGLLLDIVPNHMGISGPENTWWWDVLGKGRDSRFANYFDIDWEPSNPQLRGKVLAPVLGDRYERVLEKGELQLKSSNGVCTLHYYDWQFPIAGEMQTGDVSALATSRDALDKLIQRQHYLLAHYSRGDQEVNYRRFFAISTLAAVRVEDVQVFDDVHALLRRWLEKSRLDGLRVDHPDGLRDPGQYLQRLRSLAPTKWILVEKILEPGESLPGSWPIAGTTGYDFLNVVNGMFVNQAAEKALTDFYAQFTGEPTDYANVVRNKKKLVLNDLLAAEVGRLTRILDQIGARSGRYRDFSGNGWREAVIELVACLPVYRTFICATDEHPGQTDTDYIAQTLAAARRHRPDLPAELFDFLEGLLSLTLRGESEAEFVARFQQLAGAAMAKGMEDTALYCFNRFISLNEVGGDPAQFGCRVEQFHESSRERLEHWPDSMLSSSTHDTKRSEDVRARLDVLSEVPEKWTEAVRRWSALNERHRSGDYPDRNIEYFYYQTLVGAWPLPMDRIQAYMDKASRESSQHTAWKHRNSRYDAALKHFIAGTLRDPEFVGDLERFLKPLTEAGFVNSLAQTLIKLTAPGVPDIYQGCELWDFSLVDPDNRRPVDFQLRQRLLADANKISAVEAWQRREEGLSKLWLIQRTLTLRAQRPGVFAGRYEPLAASGTKAEHVIVFMRGNAAITIVPRLAFQSKDWNDTVLELPPGRWHNEFTSESVGDKSVPIGSLLRQFPAALLIRKEEK